MEELYKAPHVYIVGQTASGKTSFSLELAQQMGFEILNTDSLLFYKNLDIGTAKPSLEERNLVSHSMIDLVEIGGELTAADYQKQAKVVLSKKEKSFLCVGGSGFYIKALDVGLLPLPETDQNVKKEVLALEDPVSELQKVDHKSLLTIAENDLYRVRRALEVYRQTGKPLSLWKKEFTPKPFAKKIAFFLEKEELLKRVQLRTETMLEQGLIEETRMVLEKTQKTWKPLNSIGYKQVLEYFNNEISDLNALKEEIILRTMQLAKRQRTWFRSDPSVEWFSISETQKAREYIKKLFGENKWRV